MKSPNGDSSDLSSQGHICQISVEGVKLNVERLNHTRGDIYTNPFEKRTPRHKSMASKSGRDRDEEKGKPDPSRKLAKDGAAPNPLAEEHNSATPTSIKNRMGVSDQPL